MSALDDLLRNRAIMAGESRQIEGSASAALKPKGTGNRTEKTQDTKVSRAPIPRYAGVDSLEPVSQSPPPEPGIYEISEDAYHADPCAEPSLSSSIARILIQDSPRHARAAHPRLNPNWVQPDGQRHLDAGSLCHALILEGDDRAAVLPYENYRTKAAQEARDEARAAGKYPVLRHEMPEIHAMMAACREQISESEVPDAFTEGKAEQVLVWQEFNGVWCRARLDWLMTNKPIILDYKTSARSAKPSNLSRMAASNGWCMQASFYSRGFKSVFGSDLEPRFIFACQENFAPFALSLMEVSPADQAVAAAQVEKAIRVFGECLASGIWPGYSRKVERITSPPYYEAAAMEEINGDQH